MIDGTLEHILPGRIRLRFRSKRGDSAFFEQATAFLREYPAIRAVHTNFRTGSVLIHHEADTDELVAMARRGGLALPPAGSAGFGPGGTSARAGAEQRPIALSGRSAVLYALALLQLYRGRAAGNASAQFWNAYRLQKAGAPDWIPAFFVAIGLVQLFRGRLLAPASTLMAYALRIGYEPQTASAASSPSPTTPGGSGG